MANLVSVHGGHSGEFCGHARDSLSDVVQAYVDAGFAWVCLTEHMALPAAAPIPEDEAQLSYSGLAERFRRYFAEARRLQKARAGEIDIYVGFETEACDGYEEAVGKAIREFRPDVVVGSVHHVRNILFDYSAENYGRAVAAAGGIVELYCEYFDRQLELIETFRPNIVGHFDLVRLFDDDYPQRWQVPAIRQRALRNLERIKALDLTLDFNVRALTKGQPEPYVSAPWLQRAVELGIPLAPGDDSHGVATVGLNIDVGIDLLKAAGANCDWRRPHGATPTPAGSRRNPQD